MALACARCARAWVGAERCGDKGSEEGDAEATAQTRSKGRCRHGRGRGSRSRRVAMGAGVRAHLIWPMRVPALVRILYERAFSTCVPRPPPHTLLACPLSSVLRAHHVELAQRHVVVAWRWDHPRGRAPARRLGASRGSLETAIAIVLDVDFAAAVC
eukprot:6199901-Pleurochrysis_carterae.AAC.3